MSKRTTFFIVLALIETGISFGVAPSFLHAAEPAVARKPSAKPLKITELIPADACVALAVKNLKELRDKGDALVRDTGAKVPMRPSQAFAILMAGMGIRQGLDENGSAAIMLVNLRAVGMDDVDYRNIDHAIVIVIPFKDKQKMVANFGLQVANLKPNVVVQKKMNAGRWFGNCFAIRGQHLLIGNDERAIRNVLKGIPIHQELSAAQQKSFSKTEVLFQVGTRSWGKGWDKALKEIEKGVPKRNNNLPEYFLIRELGESLKHLRFGLIGLRIEKGVVFNVLMQFDKNAITQKVLKRLAGNPHVSRLNGLPKGDVISAFAFNGPQSRSVPMAQALIQTALKHFVSTKAFVSVAHQPVFAGVFGEVWNRLDGSRGAMYRNALPGKHGPVCIVGILDTADPKKFLDEMKQLAIFINRAGTKITDDPKDGLDKATVQKLVTDLGDPKYSTRNSAMIKLNLIGPPALPFLTDAIVTGGSLERITRAKKLRKLIMASVNDSKKKFIDQDLLTRLKPKLIYFPKVETRLGQSVDIFQLKLNVQNTSAAPALKSLLGKDWRKIRVAIVGHQAVVLFGSNTDLFERAIKNLKEHRERLAGHESMLKFRRFRDSKSQVEFHLNLTGTDLLFSNTTAIAPRKKPVTDLSALSLTAGEQYLRADVMLSLSDLKNVLKKW